MKKIMMYLLSVFICISCGPPVQNEIETEDRLQWWDDAKFGMLICWGVYTVPAGVYQGDSIPWLGEWIMRQAKIPVAEYKEYANHFNPVEYDPDAWMKLAKEAGMKYIVVTTKHHDGFALFDTEVSDWNVVDATPYGKDLMTPLVEACRKHGIRVGFYYSQAMDWVHPGGATSGPVWDEAQEGSMDEYIDNIAIPQVKEILSNYGEVDILWWDTPRDMTPERAQKFLDVIADYPNLITNNRLGGGVSGDTETPEQSIPAVKYSEDRRFEVCMTINDTWGYKTWDHDWKSTEELLLKLSDIVSKGGNFLLNVGPTKEGIIPQPSIDRLQEIGKWMDVNGDAIYGTKAGPFPYLPYGKATRKGQKLYLHVIDWPRDGLLHVPLNNEPIRAYTLKSPDTNLDVIKGNDKVVIAVPEEAPDDILSIVVLEFEGEPVAYPIPTAGKTARSATGLDTLLINLFDGNPKTIWSPATDENTAWIEVDLEQEYKIGNVTIAEPFRIWHNRHQEFVLQYKKDGDWVDIISEKTSGSGHTQDFIPVVGRHFRLVITGPNGEKPVLNQWVLHKAI